jgi:hypothetical protein
MNCIWRQGVWTMFVAMLITMACNVPMLSGTAIAGISSRNPYKSFNVSGINYGSTQWERTHRHGNSNTYRYRGGRYR